MLVDHENLGIDTNLNLLSLIFTEIWAKIGFHVIAAINRLRRKFLDPEISILFLCDEDEFVEDHQSKINYVAIFLTLNSNFTGLHVSQNNLHSAYSELAHNINRAGLMFQSLYKGWVNVWDAGPASIQSRVIIVGHLMFWIWSATVW